MNLIHYYITFRLDFPSEIVSSLQYLHFGFETCCWFTTTNKHVSFLYSKQNRNLCTFYSAAYNLYWLMFELCRCVELSNRLVYCEHSLSVWASIFIYNEQTFGISQLFQKSLSIFTNQWPTSIKCFRKTRDSFTNCIAIWQFLFVCIVCTSFMKIVL